MAGEGPLDVAQVIEIQRVLLEDSAPRATGNFRNEQVWLGGDSYSPHGATHVAPHHERVPAAVDDLIRFANRQDLGALTRRTILPLSAGLLAGTGRYFESLNADLGVSTVEAQNAIDRLAEFGILRQNSPASRNRIWLVSEVLDSVDLFMERARRK